MPQLHKHFHVGCNKNAIIKHLMDWRYNTIWFEQINQNKIFHRDYKEKSILSDNFNESEYAILWYFKHKGVSFELLPKSDILLYLEMNWANIIDFAGIDKYPNLKRLELHYCTKLESDFGLISLKNTLKFLHINQSKKFKAGEELNQLKELRVLALNACAPIDNLKFLRNFPKLIDFRFVNTNIIDGDLTPILEHPTIRTAGFLNKRHYNLNDTQLKAELNSKFTDEYKNLVHKGDYLTYRYNYE